MVKIKTVVLFLEILLYIEISHISFTNYVSVKQENKYTEDMPNSCRESKST